MPPNLDEVEIEYEPQDNSTPRYLPDKFVSGLDSPSPQEWPAQPHLPPPGPPPHSKPKTVVSDMMAALIALPEVREIPWKPGHELPASQSTDHERIQVRGAVLLAQRGKVSEQPCARCARGTGRFSKCIYLDDFFVGACATCQMSSKGNHCTLRIEREAATLSGKKKNTKQPNQYKSPNDTIHVQPSLKRKVTSTEDASSHSRKQPRVSYNIKELESRYPPSVFGAENAAPFEKSFDDDPSELLQYVYQKQVSPNGTKRHHKQHREEPDNTMHGSRSKSHKRNGHDVPGDYLGEVGEGSYSPAINNRSSFNDNNAVNNYGHQEHREGYRPPEEPTALIDTFPRKKQKQIYSIIGGLESGLRSSRQQTENLEKQLDTLKSILGLDVDEGGYMQ